MAPNWVPNWLRIILSILSLHSFLPQLRQIIAKKDSTGISLSYVLLNLIAATEQFTLGFFFVVGHSQDSDFFVSHPRNVGDWLNMSQLIMVWFMSFNLFVACLFYSPNGLVSKARVISIYISFLLISVVPVFIDAYYFNKVEEEYKEWMWISATFFYVHSTIICPPTTIGGILALWPQWHNAKVLDIVGLTCQVVVFAFVALSWIPRVRFRVDLGEGPQNISDVWNLIVVWYQLVGWAAVDNAIFAIVQLILLCLANYQGGGVRSCGRPTEEEPLLEGQADACVVK